jgi:hypothetical protein
MDGQDLRHVVSATPEQLRDEFRQLVADRLPDLRARTQGAKVGLGFTSRASGQPVDLGAEWSLEAQLGTLSKLETIFRDDREYQGTELVAVARYMFENLVWLKLFVEDLEWGVRFYGQFLQQHVADLRRAIVKMEAEAAMFDAADAEEDADARDVLSSLERAGDDDLERSAERAMSALDGRRQALDRRIRRTFSLFAASARFNGYGWQAHLIRTRHLPRHQGQLDVMSRRLAEFEARIGDADRVQRAYRRMNWKDAAKQVGLLEHYEFLYAYTSTMLHATPMSIVTEKQLTSGEHTMLMEYLVVAAGDILDSVAAFQFSGRIEMRAITIE